MTSTPVRTAALLALMAMTTGCMPPQSVGQSSPPALEEEVELYLSPYLAMNDFAGQVLIARGDEVLLRRAYGVAREGRRLELSVDAPIPIASISKWLTATAVLLLAEEGALSTDDPIATHDPTYPRGDEITIRHLLAHLAGMPPLPTRHPEFGAALEPADFVALFRGEPLQFDPGTEHRYSNTGYVLLADLIETISGQPYAEFLEERLFGPLGLATFGHARPGDAGSNVTAGYYQVAPAELVAADRGQAARFPGAGSLRASGEDLFRWSRALVSGGILAEESLAEMLTDQTDGRGYGLGVRVGSRHDRSILEHNGALDGFRTWLTHYPDDDVTVVVLGTIGQTDVPELIARDLAAIVLGEPYETPPRRTFVDLPADQLEGLAGTYEFSPGFELRVRTAGGQLEISVGGPFSAVYAESRDAFFHHRTYSTYRFERDEEGQGVRVFMRYRDRDFEGVRQETP